MYNWLFINFLINISIIIYQTINNVPDNISTGNLSIFPFCDEYMTGLDYV